MNRLYKFSIGCVCALVLVGCSDKANIESEVKKTKEKETVEITRQLNGVSVDGYISGAKVCLDINENDVCNEAEPQTTTDANGKFSLTTTELGVYPVLSIGGIDTATNEPFEGVLKEIIEIEESNDNINTLVSPLTTISAEVFLDKKESDPSFKPEDAKKLIATNLGLDVEKLTSDPMKDDEVFVKTQQIVQTVNLLSSSLEATDSTSAFNHVISELAISVQNDTTSKELNIQKVVEQLERTNFEGKEIAISNEVEDFIDSYTDSIEKMVENKESSDLDSLQTTIDSLVTEAKTKIKKKQVEELETTLNKAKKKANQKFENTTLKNEITHVSQWDFSGEVNEEVSSLVLELNGESDILEIAEDGKYLVTKKLKAGENRYNFIITDDNSNVIEKNGTIYQGYTVAAGGSHSGAIKNGKLYTWGRNNLAQTGLGYSSEPDEESDGVHPLTPTHVTLPEDTEFVSLSFNQNYSLAIDTEGDIWSWGYNKYGELGRGEVDDNCSITSTSACGKTIGKIDVDNIVLISAGYSHALALDNNGTIWSWGTNKDGELGTGETNDTVKTPIEVDMNDSLNIIQIAAGSDFSMALDDNGTLWGWGKNNYHQMGLGLENKDDQLTPIKVPMPEGVKVKSVATGKGHVLVLTRDGDVYGWGLNSVSQIGYYGYQFKGTDDEWNRYEHEPRLVLARDSENPVIEVYANGNSSYIIRADKRIYPWGQYGSTTPEGKQSYTNLDYPEDRYAQVSNIKDLAAGALHITAIQEDDTVFTFKWSFEGSLGGGETTVDKWFYNYPIMPNFPQE